MSIHNLPLDLLQPVKEDGNRTVETRSRPDHRIQMTRETGEMGMTSVEVPEENNGPP